MERRLNGLEPGDVIRFYRDDREEHWTIYIGMNDGSEKSVIHWWKKDDTEAPRMRIDPFWTVADNLYFERVQFYGAERNMDNVVQRAIAFKNRMDNMPGEINHNFGLFNNSKHFVDWCLSKLGHINITQEDIMNVRDPRRFVYGTLTNGHISDEDTQFHNKKVLTKLEHGDVVRYFYQDYEHWALYVGRLQDVHSVIHWWDRDGVGVPNIAVDGFIEVAGHCKAEIDWNKVPVDGERAVFFATAFIATVEQFPDIANAFPDSREFAFWCRFGLGLMADDLFNLPPMGTDQEAQLFVEERMEIGNPLVITERHNIAIQQDLMLGDVITFSQQFAVCVEVGNGVASLIWWSDDPEFPIQTGQFQQIAGNRKAMIYTDRVNLGGAIHWDEMVNGARALMRKVNNTSNDCIGLFSNSMHFAMWVFEKYGPLNVNINEDAIANVEDIWEHIYEFKRSSEPIDVKNQIRRKNKDILDKLKEGDLVAFSRSIYTHYAVFTGIYEGPETCHLCRYTRPPIYAMSCTHMTENKDLRSAVPGALSVIHWWSGPAGDIKIFTPKAWIRIDSFWTVTRYDRAHEGNDKELENGHIDGHKVAETAKQAQKTFEVNYKTGKKVESYYLPFNNCEHFSYQCRYGKKRSKQVQQLFGVLLHVFIVIAIGITSDQANNQASRILLALSASIKEQAKQTLFRCMQKKV